MPEHLHYVEFFREKTTEEFLSILLRKYPFTVLLWLVVVLVLYLVYRSVRKRRKSLGTRIRRTCLPNRISPKLLLVLLFLLSLLLSLKGINQESLSSMEGTYLSESATNASLLGALFNKNGVVNSHFPLYRLLVHIALHFGSSLVFVRGISAFFGALSVPLLYLFLSRLFPAGISLAATTLFLVSPIHIYFSQSAMPYTLLSFLIFSYYLAFLRLSEGPSRRTSLFYVTVCALGLNTHALFMGIMIPPFLCRLVDYVRGGKDMNRKFLFLSYLEKTLLALMFLLPFLLLEMTYLTFFSRDFTQYMNYIGVVPHVQELLGKTKEFYAYLMNLLAGFGQTNSLRAWLLLLAFVVASLGLLFFRGIAVFLLVAGPCYSVVLMQYLCFTYLGQLNFEIRYYCFVPAFFWATLWGTAGEFLHAQSLRAWLPLPVRKQFQAAFFLMLGALCLTPSACTLLNMSDRLDNPDLRSAAVFLRTRMQNGDALCITPASFFGDVLLFHLHEPWDDFKTWEERMNTLQVNRLPTLNGDVKYFGYINNRSLPWEEASSNLFFERIWLIDVQEETLGFAEYSDRPSRRVKGYYDKNFISLGDWLFPGVSIHLYRPEYGLPGLASNAFTLTFGTDDYPYLKGFLPNTLTTAACREFTSSSAVRIPIETVPTPLEVKIQLKFRVESSVCPLEAFSIFYRVGGRHFRRDHLCGSTPGEQVVQDILPLPGGTQDARMMEMRFEAKRSDGSKVNCAPDLCFESLTIERHRGGQAAD